MRVVVVFIAHNGPGYGKCGILKPNLCPPDRMLFSCKIFIFKQSARICYSHVELSRLQRRIWFFS